MGGGAAGRTSATKCGSKNEARQPLVTPRFPKVNMPPLAPTAPPWVRDAGGHGKNKEHTGTNGGGSRSGGRSTNYAQKMRSSGSGVESHAGGGCSLRAAWSRRTSCLPGSLGGVGRGATLKGSGFGPSAVVDLDTLDHGALGCSS